MSNLNTTSINCVTKLSDPTKDEETDTECVVECPQSIPIHKVRCCQSFGVLLDAQQDSEDLNSSLKRNMSMDDVYTKNVACSELRSPVCLLSPIGLDSVLENDGDKKSNVKTSESSENTPK
jgi:hypothetical protein